MLVLDSGGVSFLAQRSARAALLLARLRAEGHWPARVPTAVLVECLTGSAGRDARSNLLLTSCEIDPAPTERLARRAAVLRTLARCGSAVDAVVVASAEPGGFVVTSEEIDIAGLAAHARAVEVIAV